MKVELIQASNNHGSIVYTFGFTFKQKKWFLDKTGLSKTSWFDTTVRRVHTHTSWGWIIDRVAPFATSKDLVEACNKTDEIVLFVSHVFEALSTSGQLSRADVQKAHRLFGASMQNVLKQYKPGDLHIPLGIKDTAVATCKNGVYGWKVFGQV